MKYEKLRTSQIKSVRALLLKKQNNTCPLCEGKIGTARSKKRPALDHDHTTGIIRDVLCINCNGMEGKIWNLLRRMKKGEASPFFMRLSRFHILPSIPLQLIHNTSRIIPVVWSWSRAGLFFDLAVPILPSHKGQVLFCFFNSKALTLFIWLVLSFSYFIILSPPKSPVEKH